MQSSESLRFAGDVNIDSILVVSNNGTVYDITAQTLDIQIYEDLFSSFITGTLVLKESFDLVNLFPFSGQEFVHIKITTPTLQIGNLHQSFYIYKLTNRQLIGNRSVSYVLHFISEEALADINKKTSKAYQGKISDIAEFIISNKEEGLETKKSVNVESTVNGAKYISNFWSPLRNLTYLANHAINSNNSPSYTFFENRDGFNFQSLESLSLKPIYQNFIMDNYNRPTDADGRVLRELDREYKVITSLSIPKAFDYIQRAGSGMYGSTLIGLDINSKKYYYHNYNMLEDFSTTKALNEFPLAANNEIFRPIASLIHMNRAYGTHNGYMDSTNSQYIQKRISLLERAEGNMILIKVAGRMDYTVGQKVYVELNKIQPISKDDTDYKDKMFSGNYIISAINHNINREMHECTLELIKESSEMDLNGGNNG